MEEKKMTKYTQLCREQRDMIQHLAFSWNAFKDKNTVKKIKSLTQMGKSIGVDRTTIAREIKRNRYIKTSTPFNKAQIENSVLKCHRLQEPPYVCNGCTNSQFCYNNRVYYNAKVAQEHYEELASSSREGVDIKPEIIDEIENIIVPLIKDKKHSINQVYTNHSDILYISKPTFYKYVNEGIFSLTNLDLPKKVKYKKRKNKKGKNRRELAILNGRRYEDFCTFITLNPTYNIFEMDTVIGLKEDAKTLLTLYFRETHFMLIRLLEKKTIRCVTTEIENLKEKLGIRLYARIFRVGLTDNGSEFLDPYHIEYDYHSLKKVSNLFYCEPNRPDQKGGIEKNHEYIRKILPKGTTFENLTIQTVKTLENHINNIPRDSLNGKTPFDLMKEKYPDFIDKLDCHFISPDDVNLSMDLLEECPNDKLQ